MKLIIIITLVITLVTMCGSLAIVGQQPYTGMSASTILPYRLSSEQKPVEPKVEPAPYKLNLEASKAMAETFQALANEEARHNAEVKRVTEIQFALMKGAGIPESEWPKRVFKPNPDGSLSFVVKEEVAAKAGQLK